MIKFLNKFISPDDDGWTPLPYTITYVSATQATIPADITRIIQKGDKIQWTQNSIVRYNYIYSATYSNSVTTITISLGYQTNSGDCSFLATASYVATNIYYSHIENPIGFPIDGLTMANPTFSSSGTNFTNQPTNQLWKVLVKNGNFRILGGGQTAASGTGTGTWTITFTAGYLPTSNILTGIGTAVVNSSSIGGITYLNTGSPNAFSAGKISDGSAICGNNSWCVFLVDTLF